MKITFWEQTFFQSKTQKRLQLIITQLMNLTDEQKSIIDLFKKGNDLSQRVLDEWKKKPELKKKIIVEYEKHDQSITTQLTGTRFNCIEKERAALVFDGNYIIATFYNVISIRYAEDKCQNIQNGGKNRFIQTVR